MRNTLVNIIRRNFSTTNPLSNKKFLFDSFPIVWNVQKSHNSFLYSNEDEKFLDFHGGFGSNPIGWNHPKLLKHFKDNIDTHIFINKLANCDFYTQEYLDFINKFKNQVIPETYPYCFFIDGGALSVENALKIAMDWKCQKNGDKNEELLIAHFQKAFHGRSGYTMSLTNTEQHKIKNFTKFNWPRFLSSPKWGLSDENQKVYDDFAIDEIEKYMKDNKKQVAGMIIEPVQCEGGDRHFTKYFLQNLQRICNQNDILFIVDEVQTGFYTTGKPWCFQHYDLEPDLVSFGKKTQQCGVFGGKRLDELESHCFNTSGRLGSTWGGNHIDMIRSSKIIDIIKEDNLEVNAIERGNQWLNNMKMIKSNEIDNIRNIGLLMSFDMKTTKIRNKFLDILKKNKLLCLGAGDKTIRMRPNLAVSSEEIEECIKKTKISLQEI
jgi:L-lysine 6-transaminase|tara:strand:- start:4763 stop:6067 length:1305 start_codon:yes stop_codon:yes gene_type:complete